MHYIHSYLYYKCIAELHIIFLGRHFEIEYAFMKENIVKSKFQSFKIASQNQFNETKLLRTIQIYHGIDTFKI